VLNCGIPEAFLDQGSHADLLNEIGLTPEKIVQRITQHFEVASLSGALEAQRKPPSCLIVSQPV
jgi:1-deoxy-D-xylulose-5-phosphate synthase